MSDSRPCPACGSAATTAFHEIRGVPVNSVLSLDSPEEARRFPRGDIRLAFCDACGFVFNAAFDPSRLEYSARYDPTQAFSPTFDRWHRSLAEQLVARYDLRGKDVIEIGCGKGEFLGLLCRLGGNHGTGFDPAWVPERSTTNASDDVEFIADFYSPKYADRAADFVCCKMTLEHVEPVLSFVSTVRGSLDGHHDTTVFFQVPDARRILEETAFWDIYYEHCSYFTGGSLARLFRHAGFEVIDLERAYGDQYLTVAAHPAPSSGAQALVPEEPVAETRDLVQRFVEAWPRARHAWRRRIEALAAEGSRVVLWGSGSKGVAFLTTLGIGEEVDRVVDINPHRQGKFMLGTGHPIVAPEALRTDPPDLVVVMNPIYQAEIEADLARLGLSPRVVTP